jgi:hypothetical protein
MPLPSNAVPAAAPVPAYAGAGRGPAAGPVAHVEHAGDRVGRHRCAHLRAREHARGHAAPLAGAADLEDRAQPAAESRAGDAQHPARRDGPRIDA